MWFYYSNEVKKKHYKSPNLVKSFCFFQENVNWSEKVIHFTSSTSRPVA